ncbi:MAG: NYN domain-containing protein [Candidatus Magasanikbacteria bacterium]
MTQVQNDPLKHPDQRVGVFIDVQNLYYSARNLFQCKVDFGNVVKDSVDDRKLIRSIAYVVRTDSEDEEAFFEALYNLGIETREKDLQVYEGGNKKADWDVGLTVDAIRLAPSLDSIIICSGDGDYVQLVEYLQKSSGKQVEIASFGKSTSTALIEQADNFLDLCEDPDRYLIGYEGD